MKYAAMLFVIFSLVSCSGSKSSKKSSGAQSPVVDDILSQVYYYFNESDSELVSKLEFLNNDTVKITKVDGSSETLKQENIDEGEEDDTRLLLSSVCSSESEGTTSYVDIRLTEASDNSFAGNLGSEVWEGTCGGQTVSCVAMLVYDVDPVTDESVPVQGYVFGLNNEDGCTPIQSEVEALLNSMFTPIES